SVSAWTRLPVIDTTRPSSTFTSRLQRSGQSSGQTESRAGMPSILPRLETQLPEKERPGVGRLLDDLGDRLADAVSGLGLEVQDGGGGHGGADQVGVWGQGAADQEPAVAAAVDRQAVRARVLLLDEPGRGRDEIVEDVLLAIEHAGAMPVLAVLPAAPQVRHGIDPAALEPQHDGAREGRRQADVDAAVAVKNRRVPAVQAQPFVVH